MPKVPVAEHQYNDSVSDVVAALGAMAPGVFIKRNGDVSGNELIIISSFHILKEIYRQ